MLPGSHGLTMNPTGQASLARFRGSTGDRPALYRHERVEILCHDTQSARPLQLPSERTGWMTRVIDFIS